MIDLTWGDIGEHRDKGDLEEWLKEERAKDKARQLNEYADTPQTESTGSPIGDYRDGVGARDTDCGWK